MARKRGLGRGLDALLGPGGAATATARPGEELQQLPVGSLQSGAHQPRRNFDAAALNALADSIKAQGVVQPLVVRPVAGNKYEIVAGERRWRAAKQAGQKTVPAVVRQMEDRAAMAVALVENIQRADLNPLEEAEALQRLIKEVGLTHDQCAKAVGRSRAAVSNLLRLFELNEDVQQLLRSEKLSFGHARALLGVGGPKQSSLAAQVVERALSVRQTEELVRTATETKPKKRSGAPKRPPIEADLSKRLGLPVRLRESADGGGQLSIRYKSKAEFDRLVKLLR